MQAELAVAMQEGMPARMLKSLQKRVAAAQAAVEACTAEASASQATTGGEDGERSKSDSRACLARALKLSDEWANSGSVLFVTVDASVAAVLLMADSLKPTAAATVAALKGLGVRPVLLTGDKLTSARRVAKSGAPTWYLAGRVPMMRGLMRVARVLLCAQWASQKPTHTRACCLRTNCVTSLATRTTTTRLRLAQAQRGVTSRPAFCLRRSAALASSALWAMASMTAPR